MKRSRIALVGAGPRGLFALERLVAHHRVSADQAVELTVYDPAPTPGAGPVYEPGQPDYLLMNYPADRIDLSWPGDGPASVYVGGSFVEWAGVDPEQAPRIYPPRAQVGEYLSDGWASLLDAAELPITLERSRAAEISREGDGFRIRSRSGDADFERILLSTGHPEGSVRWQCASATPGSSVGVRGFGLTAIDLILNLTEGRGGNFQTNSSDGLLEYRACPRQPATIRPWSRSGRPMLVKPDLPSGGPRRVAMDTATAAARDAIDAIGSDHQLDRLIEHLAGLAAELARMAGAPLSGQGSAAEALRSFAEGTPEPVADPATAIEASLAISAGQRQPDLAWALGAAWRESYPAIVRSFSFGRLATGSRPRFAALARELERLAFGPPAVNAEKMLALVRAGVLDLSGLGDPEAALRCDLQIDAVIPSPGLHPSQPPFESLISGGLVSIADGFGAIRIDERLRCLNERGETHPGLCAFGRMTEGWVIGNDSLNRSLQPELDHWAADSIAHALSPAPIAVGS